MIELMIKNAVVITVDPQRRVLMDGAVAIDRGMILDVGQSQEIFEKYPADQVIEAGGMIAMPGLINTHMHLPQVLMRGVYDNVETMDKLKNYTWPIQGSYDEQDALISVKLGLLEMVKAGTTAFLSTGLHPRYGIDAIFQVLVDSGMRAVISKYVMDTSGYALDKSALHPGLWEDGEGSLRQAVELIEKWDGAANGRLHTWISPRSVGGFSTALLKEVIKIARQFGVGITAHWSEVQNNVDYTLKTYGLRPVFFAEQMGLLGEDVVFAHGIYLDDAEIDLLAGTGTSIAHCPCTNSKLAMGVARVAHMLRAGVNVALANDGMGVNNTADLFREMRTMLLVQRLTNADPLFPTAADAIEISTLNGARAIRAGDRVGSLEPGKAADLILIDAQKPHLTPLHDPLSAVVWAANGSDVDTVIIDGRLIMRGRKVLTMDEEGILAEAEGRKVKILEQAGVSSQHIWALTPGAVASSSLPGKG